MMTHDDIARMTAPERLALIGDLWDSLSEEDTPLPMPQFQELQRRMVSFDHDRVHAMSWEHLKAELTERAPRQKNLFSCQPQGLRLLKPRTGTRRRRRA